MVRNHSSLLLLGTDGFKFGAALFWLMRAVYRRHLNLDIQKLHSQYGPYVRISPNEVSFATVEAQNTIHNPGPAMQGYFSKSGTMESMHGSVVWSGTDNVLTTTDKTAHKRLRNALLPAFTSEALFEHESIQQKHLHELIAKLRSIASEETVNLTEHLSKLIWDIVGDLSFGEPLVENQRERFDSLKIMFCQLSPLFEALQYLTRVPGIGGLVRFTVSLIPHVFRMPRGMLPTTALRKCMDWQDKRADFLTAIMNSKDNGVMLTDAEMKSNSSLLVELRTRFALQDDITGSRLLSLPFLNGCIQESLRLLPPANGKGTNRTSPGTVIDGIYIPAGVNVSADMYTIQRSPRYWAEPEEFRPERWFNHGPGSIFENHVRSCHRPFLLGPRVCLGKEVAMQSIRLIVAKLVFSFDLVLAGKNELTWEKDVESSYLWIRYGILAKLSMVWSGC
ncbi:cytochrome P450 3A19 [Leptodontidium sp. 2 PMI_412]|nr:cytochrome P450 3A19 [Leptodontidium sp. 2 PMI_412]